MDKKQKITTKADIKNTQQLITAEVLLETMLDGLVVVDTHGKIVQCNSAYAKMHKFNNSAELAGLDLSILIADKDKDRVAADVKRSLKVGTSINFEHLAKDQNGREFWVLVNASAIKDEAGNIIEMIGVIIE